MATATKRILSGSTDGKGILISSTSSPFNTINESVAGTTPGTYHEVWLWATNNDTTPIQLNIGCGASANTDMISNTLAAKSGLIPILPGLPLQNGAIISACASSKNVVSVVGFVNSITD